MHSQGLLKNSAHNPSSTLTCCAIRKSLQAGRLNDPASPNGLHHDRAGLWMAAHHPDASVSAFEDSSDAGNQAATAHWHIHGSQVRDLL